MERAASPARGNHSHSLQCPATDGGAARATNVACVRSIAPGAAFIPHLDPPSIELLALPERPLGSPVPEPSAFDRRAFTIRLGGPSAGSPSADGPHTAYTVDRPVQPRDGNPVPRYPAVLASAGVEGTVTAQFVVDTLGAVERGSIRLARSTHVLFADAVTATLQHMRFVPAQAGGRMVRQLVEQSFQFTIRR